MKRKKRKRTATAEAPPRPFGSATPVVGDARALEAEVARRRAARGELLPIPRPSDFKPVREILGIMLAKRGMSLIDMDAAEAERERAEEKRLRELESAKLEAGWRYRCPKRYREDFFIDLLPAEVNRGSVNRVLNFELAGGRGLYVVGESGRGKTRAVAAMLKRHFVAGRTVEWFDGVRFATECSRVFAETALTEQWLRSQLRPDIVFIDDIAKRFTPATQQGFFAVLDRRTAARKAIVLTSNCTGEMLAAMIGDEQLAEPTRRRLREFCEVIRF